jgi:methyl-accepting chemotaxis protein
MFKYLPDKKSIRYRIGKALEQVLETLGLRTLDVQFMFSYVLIFLLTALIGVSVWLAGSDDATAINLAGKQRMLSQRLAKETLLLQQGVVQADLPRATMRSFEQAHQALLDGNREMGIKAAHDAEIRSQLEQVGRLWQRYRDSVDQLLQGGGTAAQLEQL